MTITFADISEYQERFDADAYLRGGYRVIIVRVHSGYRPDHKWPERLAYVRSKPFTAVGYYQYLAATRDAAAQAREFVACVGVLRPNEFPILDLESGPGDQSPRARAWFDVVDAWARFPATLYSGKAFLDEHLGGPARWRRRPRWIAAYPGGSTPQLAGYPAGATWWQFTDHAQFPGLAGGVDGNVFPDSLDAFLPAARPGSSPAPAPPPQAQGEVAVARMPGGRLEAFCELTDGSVWHAWQQPGRRDRWTGWAPLGTPGGGG